MRENSESNSLKVIWEAASGRLRAMIKIDAFIDKSEANKFISKPTKPRREGKILDFFGQN